MSDDGLGQKVHIRQWSLVVLVLPLHRIPGNRRLFNLEEAFFFDKIDHIYLKGSVRHDAEVQSCQPLEETGE